MTEDELMHYGILGMKWGRRKYINNNASVRKGKAARKMAAKKFNKITDRYDRDMAAIKVDKMYRKDAVNKAKAEYRQAKKLVKKDLKKYNSVGGMFRNKAADDALWNKGIADTAKSLAAKDQLNKAKKQYKDYLKNMGNMKLEAKTRLKTSLGK